MKLFSFIAGFFRNAAPESSTRLVGILACIAGLLFVGALIAWSRIAKVPISAADIVIVFGVFAYSCTALNLRSPFPAELFAPPGTKVTESATATTTTTVAATATSEVKAAG